MSEVRSIPPGPQFAAFVGIDWADQKQVWSLQAVGSEQRESGELKHSPEAVEAWVGQLTGRALARWNGGVVIVERVAGARRGVRGLSGDNVSWWSRHKNASACRSTSPGR